MNFVTGVLIMHLLLSMSALFSDRKDRVFIFVILVMLTLDGIAIYKSLL